jgi:subtilase family serine protease
MRVFFEWLVAERSPRRAARQPRRNKLGRSGRATFEILEQRSVLAAIVPAGMANGVVDVPVSHDASHVAFPLNIVGAQAEGPIGYTPAEIRRAYGFDQVFFGSIAGDGRGQTIAIVDAFNHPFIASDLHTFDVTFGLPDPPSFEKWWQTSGGQPPADDEGWALEIALDVEWAHAMAPAANILLVESFDNSAVNMFETVQWAAQRPGVSAVSMSFGGPEWSGQTVYDSFFQTPAGHQGVTFVAASGDRSSGSWYPLDDPNPIFPASSPNVVGLGGTSLFIDALGNYVSERGWRGSGGGISTIEAKPSYQSAVTQSSTRRVSPDVSFVADPNTGVAVYDSFGTGDDPWIEVGGTSASAPIFAGLMAVVNEGRALRGVGSLDGRTQTLPALYGMQPFIRDITSGGPPIYPAIPGYDASTGLGTPVANWLIPGLVSYGTPQHEANMAFVAAAYLDILGRAVDPSSQLAFAVQIDNGVPRSTVVNAIDHSAEYFANIIVKPAYLNYLGRSADQAGLAYWVTLMQVYGLTDEQLEANFIASNEYYVHAGGTNVKWVDAMYVDLLGRAPDRQGEAYWVTQLALGVSRFTVAYGFAASLEREAQRIAFDYMHYLGRPPDASGLNYWLTQFALGATNESLITGIVSSNEYYAQHT